MSDKIQTKQPPAEWLDDKDIDVVPGTENRPLINEPFDSVLNRTMRRRAFLKGAGAAAATFVIAPTALAPRSAEAVVPAGGPGERLSFNKILPSTAEDVVVPDNYEYEVILKWGDPVVTGAPAFDVNNQTPEAQARQFGFNADLVLFYPLPGFIQWSVRRHGGLDPRADRILGILYPLRKNRPSRSAVMIVNHEYTSADDMFPAGQYNKDNPSENQVKVEIEAHGFSIFQVDNRFRRWKFNPNSMFNRRVTGSTPIEISGPLRGHDMLKTAADPDGVEVLGCLNNCAGGKTPWGTILTCEENFDQYFANFDSVPADVKALSTRIAAPGGASRRHWEDHVPRFDLSNDDGKEYNRFGYIVEIDPYDPSARPKKRTALGRFKHEGAAVRETNDGRIALYSGDDARFEYVYKFVSNGKVHRWDRKANSDLLDDGILYVARFDVGSTADDDMGTGVWLPLVWAPGNALDQAGFNSQAEVLLNTRGAADVLGATPMDRPEDTEVNPVTGSVYIAMTNNSRRRQSGDYEANGRTVDRSPDEANPRSLIDEDGNDVGNPHGQVVEIAEDGNDAGALTFHWNIFIRCGDPETDTPTPPAGSYPHQARFGDLEGDAAVAAGVSPVSDPDNLVHDSEGNLWIATDGMTFSDSHGFGQNDGIFAVPVAGDNRGVLKQFLSGVPNGEVCGPEFSGDERSFFCAIQHPFDGQAFEKFWPPGENVSKPSLIAVYEKNGHRIGK